ncbi:MAG: DoxX family protein [Crocinitomicaceae bacterium]
MTEQKKSKALHIGLWVSQSLLAAAFGIAGFMKITMPVEELAKNGMSFVSYYGVGTVRFIGISEVLGALGLILPAALRIKPFLTPFAALGIAIIMVLATSYHVTHSEPFIPTIILFLLASFVTWGRFKKAPIQAK